MKTNFYTLQAYADSWLTQNSGELKIFIGINSLKRFLKKYLKEALVKNTQKNIKQTIKSILKDGKTQGQYFQIKSGYNFNLDF